MIEGMENLKASIDTLIEILGALLKIFDVLTNPKKFWNMLLPVSFWINVTVVCICVILYAIGHKKAPKWGYTSTFIWLVIQSIGRL